MSAIIKLENKHFPVLLKELISIISPLNGGTFLDCTFGQGGYSKKILEDNNNKVIAIDRDQDVYLHAKELEKKYHKRFDFKNIKFSEINSLKIKSKDLNRQISIIDLIILSKLENSKSEIRRLFKGNAIKINDKLIEDEKLIINDMLFNQNYLKLSIGKKRHIKIELT